MKRAASVALFARLHHRARSARLPVILLQLGFALVATLASADNPPSSDHFQCYRTSGYCSADSPKKAGVRCEAEKQCGGVEGETALCRPPEFRELQVRLADRFETGFFDVRKPADLCNPADENGEGIGDEATHLRGYQILSSRTDPPQPAHGKRRGIRVENQFHPRFGELLVDTVQPDRLFVPSSKSHGAPLDPPDPATHDVDHYKCYRVVASEGSPEFSTSIRASVLDQFQQPKLYRLEKPSRLCLPVDKNGEGIRNETAHLLCYIVQPEGKVCGASAPRNAGGVCAFETDCGGTQKVTRYCKAQPQHVVVKGLATNNQFGTETFDTVREDELCVPSRLPGDDEDEDRDGFTLNQGDCDDTDPAVRPGAAETCNGRDDDCDGVVDEALGQTTCGLGACQHTVDDCVSGTPQVCDPMEGADAETCGNGADDDCDGEVDEGCVVRCTAGAPCDTGLPGECAAGQVTCPAGQYGDPACNPRTSPVAESCNALDDDCDGETDEDLGQTTCGTGECTRTVDDCAGGSPQGCVPGSPATEVCNGLDDDCDGEADEDLGQTTCGVGECEQTVESCVNGAPQHCVPGASAPETCNGLDDDCDGAIDEDLGDVTCGTGECLRTVESCVGGASQLCVPGAPSAETCNGLDDDCDGEIDEGGVCTATCTERTCCQTPMEGQCATGRTTCPAGPSGSPTCEPIGVTENVSNGGFDLAVESNATDSNGWTSENIGSGGGWKDAGGNPDAHFTLDQAGEGATDPALCQTISCLVAGRSYVVSGDYRSFEPQSGDPGKTDAFAVTVDGTPVLELGRPSDPSTWTAFAKDFVAPAETITLCFVAERDGDDSSFDVDNLSLLDPGAIETCNGTDDDCDGETDEDLGQTTCGVGACERTVDSCVNGAEQSCTPGNPATETCGDGIDDDCNGVVDDCAAPTATPTEPLPTPTATPTQTTVPPPITPTPTPTPTPEPTPTPTRSAACLDPPDDLAVWLPADGSADDVASYDEGTLRQASAIGNGDGGSGPAPGFAPGKVREAFSLNGTRQLFSLPDRPEQWPAGSFTLHAWISTTTRDRTIASKYECGRDCPAGANSYYELYVSSLGTAVISMRDSDASSPGSGGVGGLTNVADGAFHHVAAQRDVVAGKLRIYVDGVLDGETALNAGSDGVLKDDDGKPDELNVGALQAGGSHSWVRFFAGLIDEVQLLNRALTDAEIRAIYEAGAEGYCKEGLTTGVCREGLACSTGSPGICTDGHTACPDGTDAPPVCTPDRTAVEEICASGTDDDCDGAIDESDCRDDGAPKAADDAYDARAGETRNVAAPGVLANDTDPDADALTARLTGYPLAGEVTLEPDGSFAYTPDAVGTGDRHDDVNLTAHLRPTVTVSSALFDLALGRPSDVSLVDGTPREWCTSDGELSAFADQTFPGTVTVRGIRYFAAGNNWQRNFTKAVFELYGPTGTLRYATPEITLAVPTASTWPNFAPRTLVDVEALASGPVTDVKRVRFRPTGYQQPGSNHCAAEINVWGDSPVPPAPPPAEVNLGELYAVGLGASGFASDIHRPEAANDEHPSTAWYASSSSGAFYDLTFPADVTATRVEVTAPFTQIGGGAQSGHMRCTGRFELFDVNGAVLADTGEVTIDTGNASLRSFPFPDVAGVRRMRLTQTQTCSLYQTGFNNYPMGFGAIRLIGPPPDPLPRFDMFERYRVQTGIRSTPLVANLTDDNGDGEIDRLDVPDILGILLGSTTQNGVIKAVSGDDGLELFTAGAPNLVSSFSEPAVGDIDGDGLVEIVVVHSDGLHLIAFENDGAQKWLSDAHPQPRFFIGGTPVVTGAVAIANLDGAGLPEIIVGAAVYDADGHLLGDGASLGGTTGGGTNAGGPKRSAISVVADVDLDGVREILAGPTAYELRNGALVKSWQRTDRADGFAGVANFDADPEAEIVVVANGQVYMLNHDGSDAEVWNPSSTPPHAPIALPSGGSGGAPTIADFDGDGVAEIGVAGFWGYTAFRRNGSVLWQTAISDYSSNSTGSTVFDFDQDGSVEVLYRDENWLRVYRGKDGLLLGKKQISSATWTEEPVVADVDGDGDAEIVIVGENTTAGISVFEDVGGGWAPTRRIWNQHAYAITNVNEDGTLPMTETTNWLSLGLNNLRLNTFGPEDVRDREDSFQYVANDGLLDSAPATVRITVEANRPPSFTSTPSTHAGVGIRYTYAARATDPDPGDTLMFSLPIAPAGMTIDPANGLVGWTPDAGQLGDHPVTVRVVDEAGNVGLQKYVVTVAETGAADVDDDGDGLSENEGDCNDTDPTIRPGILDAPGDGIDQDCDGADDADPETTDDDGDGVSEQQGDCNDADPNVHPGATDTPGDGIDQDCTGADGDDPLTTDDDGDGFSESDGDCDDANPSIAPGAADAPGDGIDQNCNGVDSVAGDDTAPTAEVTTPADLAEVTAPTDVLGTADDRNFLRYTLGLAAVDDTTFAIIGSGTSPVVNGVLGRIDPTLLENGLYRVLLTVEDANGQTSTAEIVYAVSGEMKVGHFRVSFNDLTVPLSGIPIVLTRTYDSRVKTKEDFGVGWTLDVGRGLYQHNRTPGLGWQIRSGSLGFPCRTIAETRSHLTEIRLSDRESYTFALTLSNPTALTGGCEATASFRFIDGETLGATLKVLSGSQPIDGELVFYENGGDQVSSYDDLIHPYNPTSVRLATADGRMIDLELGGGITRIEDLNGNAITIDDTGISHSSGQGVAFTRDGQGRLSEITDPAGKTLLYTYDAGGDLATFTDQAGNRTTFTYDSSHHLLEIHDPLGDRAVRNEYDAEGRLVATIDAQGNRIELTHSLGTRQEVIRDRLGRVTIHDYDDAGNVVATTDALGNRRSFTYDARGNQLTETDPLGRVASKTYDGSGNVLTETDFDGNTISYTYDARNRLLTISDPEGRTTTNAYDSRGNLIEVADPEGGRTRHTYDSAGNAVSTTDPLGNVTARTFDAGGRIIEIRDPLGFVTTFGYDDLGNESSETRAGRTAKLEYDPLGRLTTSEDSVGARRSATYLPASANFSRISDASGNGYDLVYDAAGNLVEKRFQDGSVATRGYDADGRETTRIDRDGNAVQVEYDALGREVRIVHADGSDVTTAYDAVGRIRSKTDERGNLTTYAYDANRQIVTDALGNTTVHELDAEGRTVATTDALGHTTRWEYDSRGNVLRASFPDGSVTSTTYDLAGRRVAETDAAGGVTRFDYDALGRLIRVTDPAGGVTAYSYDELGNLLSQTDANGRITRMEYDGANRVTKRVRPLGQTELFVYDANGNVVSHTDFNGHTTTMSYDTDDRLVRKTLHDGSSLSYAYTAEGLRTAAADDSYVYDSRGRMLEDRKASGEVLSYAYDRAGNRTSVTTPQETTNYTYDTLNRLASVTDANGTTTYAYDAVGNLGTVRRPNGVVTTYSYDARNRLVAIDVNGPNGPVVSYAYVLDVTGKRIQMAESGPATNGRTVDYAYDAAGRLVSEAIDEPGTASDRAITYTYDGVGNRLTKTVVAGAETTETQYVYDDNDRLTSETTTVTIASRARRSGERYLLAGYGFSPFVAGAFSAVFAGRRGRRRRGRLGGQGAISLTLVAAMILLPALSRTGFLDLVGSRPVYAQAVGPFTTTYEYDDNGNLVGRTDGALADRYDYDFENRLIAADVASGPSPSSVRYAYDADGIRTSRTEGGVTTSFLVDKNRLVAPCDESTGCAKPSPLSPANPDGGVSQVLVETSGGMTTTYTHGLDLISQTTGGGASHFYVQDGQLSTRYLTDASGVVTDSYTFDAFGVLLASSGPTPNVYLYAGEQLDPNVGFYYLRARYYAQALGRFVSADPLQGSVFDPVSLHRYLYANADPVNNADPSGQSTLGDVMTAVVVQSILVGLAFGLVAGIVTKNVWVGIGVGLLAGAIAYAILSGAAAGLLSAMSEKAMSASFTHLYRTIIVNSEKGLRDPNVAQAVQRAFLRILNSNLVKRVGVQLFDKRCPFLYAMRTFLFRGKLNKAGGGGTFIRGQDVLDFVPYVIDPMIRALRCPPIP